MFPVAGLHKKFFEDKNRKEVQGLAKKKADGMENLRQLCQLWQNGSYGDPRGKGYSKEFLASTIAIDLGRQRRWVEAQELDLADGVDLAHVQRMRKMVRGAEQLFASDPVLGRAALMCFDVKPFLETFKILVRRIRECRWERISDEAAVDFAEEIADYLFEYDDVCLGFQELSRVSLRGGARVKFLRDEALLQSIKRLISRNFILFAPVQNWLNSYCLNWEVEESNVLAKIAAIGNPMLDIIQQELKHPPDDIAVVSPWRTLH